LKSLGIPPILGTVSGTVLYGPVSGASVTAYAVTNGTMGAQAGAGTTGLSTAMGACIGSARNHSGVSAADMQALLSKLATSTGTIQ
jgi:hypothetical protein